MKKEIWQEDQPVLRDDLLREQSSLEGAITDRQKDTFVSGVVRDSQFFAEAEPLMVTINVTPFYASIGTGIAYDPAGERIVVSSLSVYNSAAPLTTTDNGIGGTTLTPASTGTLQVPLTASQVNYIYISYLQTTDPSVFTLQDITNKRLFTKADDGYKIEVVTDLGPAVGDPDLFKPNTNAVFLGVVDTAKVLDTSQRSIYNLKQENLVAEVPDALNTLSALGQPYVAGTLVTHGEHVKAVGTGVVSPTNPHGLAITDLTGSISGKTAELHEKLFHESGISGDQNTVASALYGSAVDSGGAPIAPTFARDNFHIKKLLASEAVQVNGITVSSGDIAEDFLFYFVDSAGNFLDNGAYTIYLDASSKTLKLAANGAPVNTAYRVYGMTSGTFTNLNTVALATVTANPDNFLLWQVTWDSTGVGLGNDNFSGVIDKRVFGTVGSLALARDASSDTVTIDHNVEVTKTLTTNHLITNTAYFDQLMVVANLINLAGRPSIVDSGAGTMVTVTFGGVGYDIDPTLSGNGGLDTGVWANNTWYAIHLLFSADLQSIGTCFSLSATSPTVSGSFVGGYTKRLGWVRSDSAVSYRKFRQTGDWWIWNYTPGGNAFGNGAGQDISAYVPPTSTLCNVSVRGDWGVGAGGGQIVISAAGQADTAVVAAYIGVGGGITSGAGGAAIVPTDDSQFIDVSGAVSYSKVVGYYDPAF